MDPRSGPAAPDDRPVPQPGARRWWIGALVVGVALAALAAIVFVVTARDDGRRPFGGFGEGTLKVIVVASGSRRTPAEHCSLLAATPAQKARGLMTRRDLAGYASMVFPYTQDVDARFYNRNVPMALTVAFFDRDGRWLGSQDLEPCPDMEGCPTVGSPAPFRYAVEVEKGGLARLGLGPGSQIAFAPGC